MTICKILCLSCAALGLLSSPAFADDVPELVIENFIGTINWSQGDVLSVDIVKNAKGVDLREMGSQYIIDGGIANLNTKKCKGYSGRFDIDLGFKKSGQFGGYEDLKTFPKLDIKVPENTRIVIDNAIPFIMGAPDVMSLQSNTSGCGNISIGNASDYVDIIAKGSGDFEAVNVPRATIRLVGSGDVTLADVQQLDVSLSGSGNFDAKTIGSGEIKLSGSGDIEVGDVTNTLSVESRGSGDVNAGHIARSLDFKGNGSGDFEAASASGVVTLITRGSGDVQIDGGEATDLSITARGSGDVDYDGAARSADLRASGSSDIYVNRVSERLSREASGSSDIDIDNKP